MMIAFDTDVLTGIMLGNQRLTEKVVNIPSDEQAIPIIVIEEIIRGRLNIIRRAESSKSKISLSRAYDLFANTFDDFRTFHVLPYTDVADDYYRQWRQEKIRVGTHDLRIASICIAHKVTLVSRNCRDFEQIPGLSVEFWS